MSPNADRRPAGNGTATRNDRAGHGQRSAAVVPSLVATGVYYPPAGRRRLAVVIVSDCPRCGQMHLHRAAGTGPTLRRGSCGARYALLIARIGGVA